MDLPEMNREEAANHTEMIKAAIESLHVKAEEIGNMLLEARSRGAWRAMGYASWEEYTRDEFHLNRTKSYQMLNRARVLLALEQAIDGTGAEIPEMTNEEVAAVNADLAEVVAIVTDRVQENQEPEAVTEVIEEVVRETKKRRTKVTPVHVDPIPEVEIVDGEIVLDDKQTHLEACVAKLILMLELLKDLPEPEDLIEVMTDVQIDRVMKARMWLMRFAVEIPA